MTTNLKIVDTIEGVRDAISQWSGVGILAVDVETSPRVAAKKVVVQHRTVVTQPTESEIAWAKLGDETPPTKEERVSEEVEVWDEDHNRTHGLDPYRNRLRLVQISDGADTVVIVGDAFEDTGTDQHRYMALAAILQPLLDRNLILGANLTFDIKQLQHHVGVRFSNNLWDLSIVERLLTAGKFQADGEWFHNAGLKAILKKYADVEIDKEIREEFGHNTELTREQIAYAAGDVAYLPVAYAVQRGVVEAEAALDAVEIEMGAVQGVVEMELQGMPVDQARWRAIADEAESKRRQVFDELQVLAAPKTYRELVGDSIKYLKTYNPGSSEETVLVFKRLGVKLEVRGDDGKMKGSADEQAIKAALRVVKDPEIKYALTRQLDFAEYKKQATTYGYEWLDKHINPVTGRVHSRYDQYGAKTGRYSSSKPNTQNIPVRDHPEYRDTFTFGAGSEIMFAISDFSGCELRCLAYLSQDPSMMAAFNDDPPRDLHIYAASLIWGLDYDKFVEYYEGGDKEYKKKRSTAKNVNFGICNGLGYRKLAEDSGISDDDAKSVLATWHRVFPVASNYLNECAVAAWRDGVLYGLVGHRKYFLRPDPSLGKEKYQSQKAGIEREAKNWTIQHANSLMTKKAEHLVIPRIYPLGARLCQVVHDEIVAVAHEAVVEDVAEIIRGTMIDAGNYFLVEKDGKKAVRMDAEAHVSDHWAKG